MRIRIFFCIGVKRCGRNLKAPGGGEGNIRRELLNAGTPNQDPENNDDGCWYLLGVYCLLCSRPCRRLLACITRTVFTTPVWNRCDYDPYFTVRETESVIQQLSQGHAANEWQSLGDWPLALNLRLCSVWSGRLLAGKW